ncbi:probable maltase [Contarinia nasturtii]|uniref:probable maltase n=1 Tax=Contarinia nasturtii TaxID=265458 RepID=UPI0012D37E3C|nr:probable maltase [Contarinia nasturtii]
MWSFYRIFIFLLHVLWCKGVRVDDQWWEHAHLNQIYTRSFQDSDGNGIGDINGITSRLNHLKDISVDGVWLSPIFQSPLKDFGYDISDYRSIHPDYGTMDDFERLIAQCKELDIKLLLDLVPNHSSDQHEWFKKSSNPKHPEYHKYKDYYIWNDGRKLANGTRVPPSNWRSVFGGSAWKWVDSRQSFYLHQFACEQPDLNFRNSEVTNEMDEIIRFWLRKGVAGFRVDAVAYLFEGRENADGLYDDEPMYGGQFLNNPNHHTGLSHIYTMSLKESYDLVCHFHEVIKEDEFSNLKPILMTEAYVSLENQLKYYANVRNGVIRRIGAEVPFNFRLLTKTTRYSTAVDFKVCIEEWINHMPKGEKIRPNWVLGNHDNNRLSSKYGATRSDIFNILIKTLPGITITYYGEEISMVDVKIPPKYVIDKLNLNLDGSIFTRDSFRTPMQWNRSVNAGFTKARKPWLPVSKYYMTFNVESQKSGKRSHLKVFQKLMDLRKHPTMKYGELKIEAINCNVLAYKREIENVDVDVIVVILNLGQTRETIDANASLGRLPKQMKIAISSIQFGKEGYVNTRKVTIPANVGLVLIGRK